MEVPDEFEGCVATVPSQEIAKPKRNYDLSHLSKRTKEQHVFAAHMMPGRKATITSRRVKQQSKEQENNVTALLRDSFFLLDRRAKIKQVRGVVSIVADGQRRFPASTTINTACTQKNSHTRRGEDIRLRHASCMSDNNLVDAIGKEFERNPPDKFVASMPADATPETLTPNPTTFIDS